MNTGTVVTQGSARGQDTCHCLLIRLGSLQLLVPRILVAEVVNHTDFDTLPRTAAGIEHFAWRGYQVPLISPALVYPQCAEIDREAGKVIILHGLLDNARLPYYGMTVPSNPRLIEVAAENICEDEEAGAPDAGELMRIRLDGEAASIPKVDYLESQLHSRLHASRRGSRS